MTRPRDTLIGERLDRGLSLNEVATGAGIRTDTLCKAEDGAVVRMTTARRLAAFYGRSVVELFPDWAQAGGRFNGSATP